MPHVCIIGGGNVAWHLFRLLSSSDEDISVTILDRIGNIGFKSSANLKIISTLKSLPHNADLYILAVRDNDIQHTVNEISSRIPLDKPIVHTSGTASLTSLLPFENRGCMWPIQSLTKGIELNPSSIPWAVCSNSSPLTKKIEDLINGFESPVYPINESDKIYLHIGAVIINNFTNHIYHLTEDYLHSKNLNIKALNPLMRFTIEKLQLSPARDAQTGPARRNDKITIQKHMELLEEDEVLQELYKLISASIEKEYKKD